MRTNLIVVALVGALALACSNTDAAPEFEGEAGDQSEVQVDDAKADIVGGTYTYYSVRRDYRRCAFPHCGGYWVDRLNRSTTRCADGTYAPECYVVELDLVSKMGFRSEEEQDLEDAMATGTAILRGVTKKKTYETGDTLGLFEAREAWTSATDAPADGTFVKAARNGVVCFTYPCPSFTERKLNSSLRADIAGVDLSGVDLTQDQQRIADVHLSGSGLIVSGYRTYETGPAGRMGAREATQVFTEVIAPQIEPIPPCFVGGCSGEVCSDDPGVVTTCIWHESYACYPTTVCERGADFSCGWRETPAFAACIADAWR